MRISDICRTVLAGVFVLGWIGEARALNCSPGNGITYVCDEICASATCAPSSHSDCDDDGLEDGKCTICGDGDAETITGTSGADVICANGGADVIDSGDGGDIVDGGNGNDDIAGGTGDDALFGGAGNDVIVGEGGRDFMSGGAGDDEITTNNLNPDDDFGSLLCGGKGYDVLVSEGPGHQCMDAGPDQSTPTDCLYHYTAQGTQGSNDVGTARNCAAPSSIGDGFISDRHPPCGCDD